jgi:hypothetical protein
MMIPMSTITIFHMRAQSSLIRRTQCPDRLALVPGRQKQADRPPRMAPSVGKGLVFQLPVLSAVCVRAIAVDHDGTHC